MEERGAGDGVRTRDIQLGKLTLCQLSYSRPGEGQSLDETVLALNAAGAESDSKSA
jgi:hypothetical protein